jgi:hypothetical protein
MFVNANAQITLSRAEHGEVLYIYEKQKNESTLIDSITTLSIFSEYSYSENNKTIYLVWSAVTEDGKVYYLNTYSIGEKKVSLKGQYWIDEAKHKELFKRGLRVAVTDEGLQLSFSQGKFALLVFSFDELNLKDLSKELSKIAKL